MKRSEEIVVIGAGIIGVSIAYNLALKGAKVTVLDKQTPGTGCTQGAFAMLIAGHSEGTESFNALYSLAVKEWRQLEAQLNESLPIQWGGVVNWAGPGDRSDELLVAREKLKSWGVKVHDLVEEDIRDLIAGINPGQFACGSFLPDQGVVDIDRIFAILIRHATQAGVVLMTPVEVKDGITTDSGEIMLSTTQGSIKADRLVLAAGAGVPALAEMFTGVHIPISLASGTLAYSRPMPHILHRVINGPLGSIKQDQDGRIICGPDYRPGANGTNIDPEYGQRLLDNAMKVLPALAGIKLDHMTVGHVPIPKDSVPIVGFCDNTKTRIYVATMMSGVTMAPLMGRLIASEILGQPEPLLASYRPDRFGKTPLLPPSVLIIGAGAVGISTAWHLSQSSEKRARYRSIHVLDRCPPPSSMAAATDINKIIRSEYSDPVYEKLALEALEAWNDPNAIFQKHFHPSGWLLSASGGSLPFLEQSALNARVKGVTGVKFMTPAEVRTSWPALTGDMRGWKILASPAAGWAAAGAIMVEMVGQCVDHGVVFSSGLSGHVKTLLFDEGGSCIGARTVDGTEQFADCVILAAGANTASLIDLDGQQQAVGHTVCCLQLSPQEASRYTNMTIVANIEEGMLGIPVDCSQQDLYCF